MKNARAFTLIELLMVLAVLAILMGMLIPSVGIVRENAQRMATGQKLRQIGLAVASYQQATGRTLVADDLAGWLARIVSETGLRDGKIFLFDEDPLLAALGLPIPPVLAERAADGSWQVIADFARWPIGVTVVSGLPAMAPPSTTPVAWTRGLQRSGKWREFGDAGCGIYGSNGGFVVFLDGHVEFHRDLAAEGGVLVDYLTGRATGDIVRALPPGARAYSYLGREF